MIVIVNGEAKTFDDGATVRAVAESLDLPEQGVAIAVGGDVVPTSAWDATPLTAGVEVDVLTAVQGG